MNPIEMLFSWQALLVAAAATGITQLVKTLIDVWWGSRAATPKAKGDGPYRTSKLEVGKSQRKRSVIINRFVLPMCPILVGMLFAVLVPARPEVIIEYVQTHAPDWTGHLIYAAWGAACGQFADYLWTKAKEALAGIRRGAPPEDDNEG